MQTPLVLVSYSSDQSSEREDPLVSSYVNKFICEIVSSGWAEDGVESISISKGDVVRGMAEARNKLVANMNRL